MKGKSSMKLRAVVFVLVFAMYAGPAFAQTPAPQTPPPAAEAPAPQAAAPAQPAPVPFPEGAKVAYVDFQRVASESAPGKAAAGKILDFQKRKQAEAQVKNKELQGLVERQKTQASVLSDAAASQLAKDIEKAQRDLQYFQNEYQAELETLNNELMREFQQAVLPIVQAVATERGLHMVFNTDAFIFANRGLDLTAEVIARANAGK